MEKTKLFINVVLVLMLLSSCDFFNWEKRSIKDIETILEDTGAFISDIIDSALSDSALYETIEQETEPVKMSQNLDGYGRDSYYMVVGSFMSENLANKYARKMQEMGYQPQVIYSNSLGFYRVSARSYDNFQTAVNDVSEFRNNVTPRAWVHVKR